MITWRRIASIGAVAVLAFSGCFGKEGTYSLQALEIPPPDRFLTAKEFYEQPSVMKKVDAMLASQEGIRVSESEKNDFIAVFDDSWQTKFGEPPRNTRYFEAEGRHFRLVVLT